jgi:PAS domain S-box-containing protein
MTTPLRLLMVEDSEGDARLLLRQLERGGFAPEWERVETAHALQTALARQPWDVILADYAMPRFDAPAALQTLQASGRDIPFIVVSGAIGEDVAVEMMKQGAHDYVLKQNLARLAPAIQRELNEARQRAQAQAAKRQLEEQRETDQLALRLTTDKLKAQAELLDLTQDAIVVCDLVGQIQFWNKGAERLYDRTAPEAIGQNLTLTVEPAGVSALQDSLVQTHHTGGWNGELQKLAKTSRKLTVQSRCSLVRNAAGAPQSILVVETDVTEKKQLEAEHLRAQRVESIGTLANGIAHDINNILVPIGLIVPMLREQVKDPTALRWLDMVEASVQRGAAIIKQVVTFSRGQRSEKVPTSILRILEEVANVVRETFPKTIRLETRWPKELWLVVGDATQLQQVLMNLAINARDAMPEGGILTLAAENVEVDELFACSVPDAKAGPHVAWLVTDTGQGISPEHLERIFDPFFTTKEVGKGTGLGLSTVLGIVRDHRGFIRVESQVGEGSRFRVYVPAQPGAVAAAEESSQWLAQGKGELILVVDDEESIRNVTKTVLERNGYQVLLAGDGIEALTLITQNLARIQAVLTDLIMPQMDGLTLIRAVQKLAPQIKTLATTGGESASRFGPLSLQGLKTVLRKPFTPAALLQSLRALLDGEPPPATGSTTAHN